MSTDDNLSDLPSRQTVRTEDAVFIGWQKSMSGNIFALYNILKLGHPSYHSTVDDKTLQKLHLRIPWTPSRTGDTVGGLQLCDGVHRP